MLSLPPSVRIFVARAPTDMRKAFDGLSGLVNDVIREDVFSGHLFVFVNRRKDRVKVLWWDRTGFWLLYKRLEKGTLPMQWLSFGDQECVEMTSSELTAFLEGIDLRRAKRLPRYDDGRMSKNRRGPAEVH